MRHKILCAGLILAVVLPALCLPTRAQTQSCYGYFIWYFPDILPVVATCGPGQGPFSMLCYGPIANCHAPTIADGTCPTCGNGIATASKPINLNTGNSYIQHTDIRVPGLGGGLNLVRTWNSIWPATQTSYQIGIFGPNWRSTYEERVYLGADGYMRYLRADGSFWSFASVAGGTSWSLAAPANSIATLSQDGTNWTLIFQNGEQRMFAVSTGALITIIDRNNNQTQLTYDGINRLVTVTDAASRHLYLSYASGSSRLVTGIISDIGLTLSYTYNTSGYLTLVTNPDLSTLAFQYDANSRISAVVDSNSKVIESHTYDSQGRGLTASKAGGVEAVTVSYPQ